MTDNRTAGAAKWRTGKIYFHTKGSGIWVAPRRRKIIEGSSPSSIAAKAIRLLKKRKLHYLGAVDKVAVDDSPSARKRIHRLFLYNIKNGKPHRYDFRRAYANTIHKVLSSKTGLMHPNARELLPESQLQAKRARQKAKELRKLKSDEKVALKAFFARASRSKSKSKSKSAHSPAHAHSSPHAHAPDEKAGNLGAVPIFALGSKKSKSKSKSPKHFPLPSAEDIESMRYRTPPKFPARKFVLPRKPQPAPSSPEHKSPPRPASPAAKSKKASKAKSTSASHKRPIRAAAYGFAARNRVRKAYPK